MPKELLIYCCKHESGLRIYPHIIDNFIIIKHNLFINVDTCRISTKEFNGIL